MKSVKPGFWRRQLHVRFRVWAVMAIFVAIVLTLDEYVPRPDQVVVSGSDAAMGRIAGDAAGWKVKFLVSLYLQRLVCNGDSTRIEKARAAGHRVLATMGEPYREELIAYAEAAGVDTDMLAFGNSFIDLGDRALGCRSAVFVGDRLLHAHNLDWNNLAGMAKWSATITRRAPDDGRLRTVSVGFPGIIGALDIINEKGIALSFNQLGSGADQVTEPVFIMIRRIAETTSSFREAQEMLLAAPPGMPFIITVSSATERTGSVFERSRGSISERPLNDARWVAAANGAQGEQTGISCIGRLWVESPPATLADLQATLRDPEVLASFNLYSVIFDFSNNTFYLASGALPAAEQPYRQFSLFP